MNYLNQKIANKIILSGSSVHNKFVEADVMAEYCMQNKLPKNVLIIEPHAKTTIENARFTKRLMIKYNFNSAIIVTSKYHRFRTLQIFKDFHLDFVIETAKYPGNFSLFKKIRLYLFEYYLIIGLFLKKIFSVIFSRILS